MRFWNNDTSHLWRYGVLAGILCIGIGLMQGDFTVIWQKAVMICLECIGIG